MTTISISNLETANSELMLNSDSYIDQLTDAELDGTQGGLVLFAAGFVAGVALGIAIGRYL